MEETAGDRLKRTREAAGFRTAGEFARAADVPEPTYRSHENGGRGLTDSYAKRYAKKLGVPWIWLRSGEGSVPTPVPATDAAAIPEIDARAGAGLGGESGPLNHTDELGYTISTDEVEAVWRLPDRYMREIRVEPARARIIEVTGDSMAPTLAAGDKIMVDQRQRIPSPGGLFVIWDGMGLAVKRLEIIPRSEPVLLRVISDNAHHGTYDVPADELHIIGRVVWRAHRL